MPKVLETTRLEGKDMESLGSIDIQGVLAHLFFIGAGVAVGIRAADDLVLWRAHRAAKQVARNRSAT